MHQCYLIPIYELPKTTLHGNQPTGKCHFSFAHGHDLSGLAAAAGACFHESGGRGEVIVSTQKF